MSRAVKNPRVDRTAQQLATGDAAIGPPGPDMREDGASALLPPQDREAERAVIGSIMVSKNALADCLELLQPRDFYRPVHELIYDAAVTLHGRGEPVDTITVADELSNRAQLGRVGGQAYLHECVQAVPTPASAGYYAEIVHRKAGLRRLAEVGASIVQMANASGESNVIDLVTRAGVSLEHVTAHAASAGQARSQTVSGGAFILDAPDSVPALWGHDDNVLWARGESLMLGGPPGVGKTTLAGQLVRGRLRGTNVLGHPVVPTSSRVLYLAMDRPQQIARALRRTLGDIPRENLDKALAVWQGPPLSDIARHPETLLSMAEDAGADTLVVDSLKDAALGLTDDEVGAGYNRARQHCIANGIELLELHHVVKRGLNGAKPKTLADLYGSTWLTSGAGSVILLWGDAGDPVVEMHHLKQPAAEVGPLKVIHNHDAGTSALLHETDLVAMARNTPAGLTARDAAKALFETGRPSSAQVEKARRRLTMETKAGRLTEFRGDKATASVWVPNDSNAQTITAPFTHPDSTAPHHAVTGASRRRGNPQATAITDGNTGITQPDLHALAPSYKGGESEGEPYPLPMRIPEATDDPTRATAQRAS